MQWVSLQSENASPLELVLVVAMRLLCPCRNAGQFRLQAVLVRSQKPLAGARVQWVFSESGNLELVLVVLMRLLCPWRNAGQFRLHAVLVRGIAHRPSQEPLAGARV